MTGPCEPPGQFGPPRPFGRPQGRYRGNPDGWGIDALAGGTDSRAMVLDHRMWELLGAAVRIAAARGVRELGPEDVVLAWLAEPGLLPVDRLAAMGLPAASVFASLARLAPAEKTSQLAPADRGLLPPGGQGDQVCRGM